MPDTAVSSEEEQLTKPLGRGSEEFEMVADLFFASVPRSSYVERGKCKGKTTEGSILMQV